MIPWEEIKERWLSGEKPKVMASDYHGVSAKLISQKAYIERWRSERKPSKQYEQVDCAMYDEDDLEGMAIIVLKRLLKRCVVGDIADNQLMLQICRMAYVRNKPGSRELELIKEFRIRGLDTESV